MPISRGSHLSEIINVVKRNNPSSILDVGCGWGLNGTIFRAYTDIRMSEIYPERYHKYETRIDGIEIFPDYANPLWNSVYSTVYIGDALEVLKNKKKDEYDLVYCGDMIEHLSNEDGKELLKELERVGKVSYIATPYPTPAQDEILGNSHEKHISSWSDDDFIAAGWFYLGTYDGIIIFYK